MRTESTAVDMPRAAARGSRAAPGGDRGHSFFLAVLPDLALIPVALILAMTVRSIDALAPLLEAIGSSLHPGLVTWDRRETALVLYQIFSIPLLLQVFGQYRAVHDARAKWSLYRVVACISISFAALLAVLFVLRIVDVPRMTLMLDFAMLVVLLSGWRAFLVHQRIQRFARGRDLSNVLLLGTHSQAQAVAGYFATTPDSGRRVIGFLGDDVSRALLDLPAEAAEHNDITIPAGPLDVDAAIVENTRAQARHVLGVIGELDEKTLERALDGLLVQEVFVGPDVKAEGLRWIMNACQERGVSVHLIPEHHAPLGLDPQPWQAGGFTFLDVQRAPMSRVGGMAKRATDLVVACLALILLSPLLLVCAVAIKVENPRSPVFYGGWRIGLHGQHFRQWKFVTMQSDADEMRQALEGKNAREGPWFQVASNEDHRITKVGRVLRRFSLNDIPQFWNVIRGEMSMVGPRPLAVDEVARFIDFDLEYYRIFHVKPGITGLWQIGDRLNPSFEYRVGKDLAYIRGWSIWRDLRIMMKTPWAMLRRGR